MSLFGIGEKLYKKKAAKDISAHEISDYDPKASPVGESLPQEEDAWVPEEAALGKPEKKKIKIGLLVLGGIFGIILLLAIIFEAKLLMFNSKHAQVSVVGPTQIDSGKEVSYEIDYHNSNWVNLKNATLKITYPENFRPEEDPNFHSDSRTSGYYPLGTLRLRSNGKIIFKGKAYSPKGALIYLKADLNYDPAVVSGSSQADAQLGVSVVPAPIILEINGQQKVTSGNAVNYTINYQNNGSETLKGLELKVSYPDGFTFVLASSNPASTDSGAHMWNIADLKPGQSGQLTVDGRLSGTDGTVKIAKAQVGEMNKGEFMSYNDETTETGIVGAPLAVSQTINGKSDKLDVSAGESLQFILNYKNNSNIGMRNVILTEKLDSPVLDYATLRNMQKGSFNDASRTITWKASDIPGFLTLSPGQSGQIKFSIDVKKRIPLDGKIKKNFVIVSLAKIDSPDVPTPIGSNKIISSNEMDIKLNSKIILEANGFYNDATIKNSGPIPPKIGQDTTYTLHWKVTNVSNDINDAKVTAYLPTNVVATGKISPDDARLSYDKRSNLVTWDIGKIDAGTGILTKPLEVAFQVRLTPSTDEYRKTVNLMEESALTAKDLFTGEDLETKADYKDINLTEDRELMKESGGYVAN